jgi:uncharacterized damage-inducible protein DinB
VKPWFDRTFATGLPVADAPQLLDRLGAAPDRIAAALGQVPVRIRIYKPGGRWSIQEHAGHLLDLEELWASRLDDFEQGRAVLRIADLQNRRTHEARHNEQDPGALIGAFRTARTAMVDRLQRWSPAELARVSRHPRLDQAMSAVDLCFFVAEHDDHHLAAMAGITSAVEAMPGCAVDLANTVEEALPLLRRLGDDVNGRQAAPGKWSPREIIGHLIDSASNNHQRFVRAAFQEDLVFAGYDQDQWVALQRYQDARWEDLLTLWASFNHHLARVMAATPGGVRRREQRGHNFDRIAFRRVDAGSPATLEYFMEDYVLHLQHHLRQIFTTRAGGADGGADGLPPSAAVGGVRGGEVPSEHQ